MTRRPHLSVTPTGLAYISGDYHDRDSAHHAENVLRTIWANLDHPAVKAANAGVQEWLALPGPFDDDPVRLAHDMTTVCITAALPHLTADDLRDTPNPYRDPAS